MCYSRCRRGETLDHPLRNEGRGTPCGLSPPSPTPRHADYIGAHRSISISDAPFPSPSPTNRPVGHYYVMVAIDRQPSAQARANRRGLGSAVGRPEERRARRGHSLLRLDSRCAHTVGTKPKRWLQSASPSLPIRQMSDAAIHLERYKESPQLAYLR